jgi:hypothetical protein
MFGGHSPWIFKAGKRRLGGKEGKGRGRSRGMKGGEWNGGRVKLKTPYFSNHIDARGFVTFFKIL